MSEIRTIPQIWPLWVAIAPDNALPVIAWEVDERNRPGAILPGRDSIWPHQSPFGYGGTAAEAMADFERRHPAAERNRFAGRHVA
jgi:hypothetical protein